jgi:hypothetical protein
VKPSGCAAVLLLAAAASVATPATKPVKPDAGVAAELRRATQELMSAVAEGNWAVWDKYLDDSILYTAEDGRTLTKAQLREEMKPLPPGFSGTIEVESADVRQYGDVAVVSHEVIEHETVFGQKLVSHYHTTDTWLRKGGRWRLIATQVLVRLADPPAATVDRRIFDDYVGHYEVSPTMTLEVTREGDKLFAERNGRPKQELLPEMETVFFTPGAPRTRKIFARDAGGKVVKIFDRRDGRDIVWTRTAGKS